MKKNKKKELENKTTAEVNTNVPAEQNENGAEIIQADDTDVNILELNKSNLKQQNAYNSTIS